MPGMDGLELLGESKLRRPDLAVMMVTAYGERDSSGRLRMRSSAAHKIRRLSMSKVRPSSRAYRGGLSHRLANRW
jgi:CheY-like chemotaxis protein